MSKDSLHVLVLGGGITGLAAAYRLSRREDRPRVTLIEAGPRLGGKLRTECVQGFVIDTGPETLAPRKPHASRLADELGVELAAAAPAAPGAVLVKGRLRTMPEGIGGFIPRRIRPLATTRLFSPAGKARMALEGLIPARRDEDDESLEAFTSRRLGRLELVCRWTRIMPQYQVGHLDRVAEIERQLEDYPGVLLAGSGTHGLGIPDCVASAERAAASAGI
jgi:protoporphyrinogen oxidase